MVTQCFSTHWAMTGTFLQDGEISGSP